MTPSNTTQGAKPPRTVYHHAADSRLQEAYELGFREGQQATPTAPASPSPVTKNAFSLDEIEEMARSPVTEETNSHTCEEDFQHYLTYSQQAHLSDADKAMLRHAYSAAWSPTPSPSAPAQQEQAHALLDVALAYLEEHQDCARGQTERLRSLIGAIKSLQQRNPVAPSAAQQDKGWAERLAAELVGHNYHVEALKKGGTYEREIQAHLAIILRHAPPNTAPEGST